MSLRAFQQTLGELVADRSFCQAVRNCGAMALMDRDLSPRELRQLAAMAGSRGMVASGTLYRFNRLTPLKRCLPRTLAAFGAMLPALIDNFWRAYPETRLQFDEEVMRFVTFVEAQITAGMIMSPLIADTLALEAAACRLLLQNSEEAVTQAASSGSSKLHPQVAVVRFQMEPTVVLAGETDGGPLGEHYIVLDARGPELQARAVPVAVGRVLAMAQAGLEVTDDAASHAARAAGWMREST